MEKIYSIIWSWQQAFILLLYSHRIVFLVSLSTSILHTLKDTTSSGRDYLNYLLYNEVLSGVLIPLTFKAATEFCCYERENQIFTFSTHYHILTLPLRHFTPFSVLESLKYVPFPYRDGASRLWLPSKNRRLGNQKVIFWIHIFLNYLIESYTVGPSQFSDNYLWNDFCCSCLLPSCGHTEAQITDKIR